MPLIAQNKFEPIVDIIVLLGCDALTLLIANQVFSQAKYERNAVKIYSSLIIYNS